MDNLHILQTVQILDSDYPVLVTKEDKWRTCVVIKEYPKYYLVVEETGGYRITILKADIYSGKVKVKAGRLSC